MSRLDVACVFFGKQYKTYTVLEFGDVEHAIRPGVFANSYLAHAGPVLVTGMATSYGKRGYGSDSVTRSSLGVESEVPQDPSGFIG